MALWEVEPLDMLLFVIFLFFSENKGVDLLLPSTSKNQSQSIFLSEAASITTQDELSPSL